MFECVGLLRKKLDFLRKNLIETSITQQNDMSFNIAHITKSVIFINNLPEITSIVWLQKK